LVKTLGVASTYVHIAKRYELVISLYWTLELPGRTLHAMQKPNASSFFSTAQAKRLALTAFLIGGALLGGMARAGGHEAVSADAAAQALAQGASVVDVRSESQFAQGHLPGAARLAQGAGAYSSADLARAVSQAGVDLSRTVVVVGEPGDVNAQALWRTLSSYATGRVLWLVGGTTEWQMTGRALTTQLVAAKAVPQYLVLLDSQPSQARMAGQALRDSANNMQAKASLVSALQ
jgi:rhodanese-related sulfurtransferase